MKKQIQIASGENNLFGEGVTLFELEESGPASLSYPKQLYHLENILKIQIKKDNSAWKDYEPGFMLLAKKLECRLSSPGESVEVELVLLSS